MCAKHNTVKPVAICYTVKPVALCIQETKTFANSEEPDEMQHNAAFHQGVHCL